MAKRKQTKFEKQYYQLARRGIDITPHEFRQYYDMTRRAKNKLRLIANRGTLLINVKLSNEVGWIHTRKDFDYGYSRLIDILTKGYTETANERYKQNFLNNLEKLSDSSDIVKVFEQMTPREIRDFYEDNRDLGDFIYGSGDVVARIATFLDITSEKIRSRIEVYRNEHKTGIRGGF